MIEISIGWLIVIILVSASAGLLAAAILAASSMTDDLSIYTDKLLENERELQDLIKKINRKENQK